MRARLLLLTPVFHGYWRPIERELGKLGYDVTVCRYDELPDASAKLRHKLTVELPERLGRPAPADDGTFTARARDAVASDTFDIILQLKGDCFGPSYWESLAGTKARKYLWLYDEFRRTRHSTDTLDAFDGLVLYNHSDHDALAARGYETLYLPDAFDPADTPRSPIHTNAVVFIGARNAPREQTLSALADRGVPVLAVGRDWSRHPLDRARTWSWRRPAVRSSRDVPRSTGYALNAGAPAALNVHFDQDGFTMRTFEIPGSGGVQLVDRDDVAEFYEPGREVLVFHSPEELAELSMRAIRDDRWGDAIREAGRRRTLAEHTFAHRMRKLETLWA